MTDPAKIDDLAERETPNADRNGYALLYAKAAPLGLQVAAILREQNNEG